MRLKKELPELVEKLKAIKEKIPPYAKELKASGNYKDFEVRLANDCLKAVVPNAELCGWYDTYQCHDSHITTLAKRALAEIYDIEKGVCL